MASSCASGTPPANCGSTVAKAIGRSPHLSSLTAMTAALSTPFLQDDVLKLDRRDPFSAALDNVLEPVDDMNASVGVPGRHIPRVQVSRRPKAVPTIGD